jgi:glycosyltransferase involved in cell wall biosynthesis
MPHPKIAIVVPCYNTSFRCRDVIAAATTHVDIVLAVDDGSTDDTNAHLEAAGCQVLTLPVNSGKGAALEAGFRWLLDDAASRGEPPGAVITMDGDGQHDAADIPALIGGAARTGADLVIGTRDPRKMPRKNRIGAHYSRLLFLIGTGTFVADTQSGFRLLSPSLLADLINRVAWRGFESESEVLWRTLELRRHIAAVPISTLYLEGNRGSKFNAWRDSTRIASLFSRQLRWTVSMAMVDFVSFALFVSAGRLTPAAANVASRALAVACQASFRRDYARGLRTLTRDQGLGWCLLAFGGHLAITTALVAGLARLGALVILAKGMAQLAGYLATFAVIDRVLLGRLIPRRRVF